MHYAFRFIGILALVATFAAGCVTPAHAEVDYSKFEGDCMQNCKTHWPDPAMCAPYCACAVSEIRKKGDDTAQRAALASSTEQEKVIVHCGGVSGLQYMIDAVPLLLSERPAMRPLLHLPAERVEEGGHAKRTGDSCSSRWGAQIKWRKTVSRAS